jgi:hypothetical protein
VLPLQKTAPASAGQTTGPASTVPSGVVASPESLLASLPDELPEESLPASMAPEELPDELPEELPDELPDVLPDELPVASVPESPPGPPLLELSPPQPAMAAETAHPVRPPMTIQFLKEFELRI